MRRQSPASRPKPCQQAKALPAGQSPASRPKPCQQALGGEPLDGFEEVYLRYYHDVFLFLLRLTRDETQAEELTQATFMQALLHIERFEERCDLRVWLCQIAKHLAYAQAKKQKRELPLPEDGGWEDPASFPQEIESWDETFRLHLLLHELDEPYKEVFGLRVFGELPFAKIAAIFGKTESWARVTYYRAKRKIQERTENPHGTDE